MTRFGFRAGILALLAVTTPALGQRSGRRVVGAAEIAAAGWHRLGDVVGALTPGSLATVDGFNGLLTDGRLPFAGLSGAGSPQWIIRVDGQRIPVAVDGMWILDALPIAMTQVDSVVVAGGGGIVDGQASLLGTVDVYSRRPRKGLSGIGDYEFGDESGDPGPYRYTSRATPNVEKLGPFASGAAAIAHGGWSLDAAVRYSSLNVTDTSIVRRFPGVFPDLQSDVNASGGSGVLTTTLLHGTQYTIGGRGRFTGLLWMPTQKREEEVRVIATQGGSSGDFEVAGAGLRYGVTSLELATAGMAGPLPVSANGRRGYRDVFGEVSVPGSSVSIGLGATDTWMSSSGSATVQDEMAQRLWVTTGQAGRGRGATASVAHTDGRLAPSVKVWMTAGVGSRYSLTTSVASIQRLAAADGGWIDQAIAVAASRDTRLDEARIELADGSRPMITPFVDVRLVNTSAWQLARQLDTSPQSAQFVVIGAGFETKPAARVAAAVRGEASAIHGSSAMQSAMQSTPAASLRGDISTVVMGDFHLAASARFATATTWPDESIFGETPDLPSLRRIDLSANKLFWHERVRAQLVIRNLLATDERYHPVGASWNFRTHLALTVALPPYGLGVKP